MVVLDWSTEYISFITCKTAQHKKYGSTFNEVMKLSALLTNLKQIKHSVKCAGKRSRKTEMQMNICYVRYQRKGVSVENGISSIAVSIKLCPYRVCQE